MGSEFPGSHLRLRTPSGTFANFHRWIHMSDQEYKVFHPRGYLSLLSIPNTRIFHFLFLLCNRETHFGHCTILSSPLSNTKHSVDLPCNHDIPSNTKHSVDLPTMHSHPFNAMSPGICNARFHCMLYHEQHNPHHLPVSWTITSPTYDFHKSFHSCQPIMQTYINIHIQHFIL